MGSTDTTILPLRDPELLRTGCFIGGEWIEKPTPRRIEVRNPATNTTLVSVPSLDAEDTREAIAAASRAMFQWRKRTGEERSAFLKNWYLQLRDHESDLATILTHEQGKPFSEARAEIQYAASYVEWFAEEARRTYGEIIPSPWAGKQLLVTREPVGVCAAITPWNFPAAMITRKVAPALAAGCTVVVKPASLTPLTALALAETARRAGIPPGALNVVTGQASVVGAELARNPAVRKLSFTGSTEVGREIAAMCAPTLKKLSMELGGNAPLIVFKDADLDAAVEGTIASKFRNTGQTCVCTNRILVHEAVYDAFARKLTDAVSNLVVGQGMASGVTQGPLIDEGSVRKVESLIHDAIARGATVVCGGRRHPRGTNFFEPTVILDATPDMALAKEEIFGPVAPLYRFKTEEEAIELANDTEYGLAAYFYTKDLSLAWRVGGELQYGMVGVNSGVLSTAVAPFGGIKQSGWGREGSLHGIEEYLEKKYLCIAG